VNSQQTTVEEIEDGTMGHDEQRGICAVFRSKR